MAVMAVQYKSIMAAYRRLNDRGGVNFPQGVRLMYFRCVLQIYTNNNLINNSSTIIYTDRLLFLVIQQQSRTNNNIQYFF